jgi:bacterioferritin-associated ferredoxin
VYVCNCNGIRERQVHAAIANGARRPVEVFDQCGCRPRCARCVRDVVQMIEAARETGQRVAA